MIELTRPQLSFAEGLIQEEVGPLWEEWMRQVDQVLADPTLVQIVYEALARRWPQSRTRGRPATPAEVVLRLLLLKHMRNWSYYILEREVRANLVNAADAAALAGAQQLYLPYKKWLMATGTTKSNLYNKAITRAKATATAVASSNTAAGSSVRTSRRSRSP